MHKRVLHAAFAWVALFAGTAVQAQGTDVTPPVLTRFDAAKVFDVSRPAAAMVVDFTASDDLSGVSWGNALAFSADDYYVYLRWDLGFPKREVTGKMSTPPDYRLSYLRPGTYMFDNASFTDDAGNTRRYEAAELATLGNISFTVVNPTGYDSVDPSLLEGEVLTPKVSLSRPRLAGVRVHAADAGDTAVSGVASIFLNFCTLDSSACISGSARNWHAPGQPEWDASLGIEIDAQPGVYHMHFISIEDHAGRGWGALSKLFEEGWLDFGEYFPSTTITVTP